MPPLPKVRISALAGVAEQLKFAPPETARKHVERAEALAGKIDPAVTYPEDWLVFQITGYRPDIREPALIVGEALRADLGALVERLCVVARFEMKDLDASAWIGRTELCRKWKVSAKTLERYRRAGLIGRRVLGADGRGRVVFAKGVVEAFEAAHRRQIGRAGTFSRIDRETEVEMLRRAAAYRCRLGLGLNEVARRLAERFGRSHEAVRQLLRRHDAEGASPIFARAGRLTPRDGEVIRRALRWGIDASVLARWYNKSVPSVLRAGNQALAERLRSLRLDPPGEELAASARAGVLELEPCRTGLGAPGAALLAEHVAAALRAGWPDAGVERARALGYWALRRRAAAAIGRLGVNLTGAAMDAIVVDLLWAARLKAELVRSEQLLTLNTIESLAGKPLLEMPTGAAAELLSLCIAALGAAVERFDPSKGGRLAAPAGLELNRVVARWVAAGAAGSAAGAPPGRAARAVPIAPAQLMRLEDWTRAVAPWQMWLEPPAAVRRELGSLDESARRLVEARYGWGEAGAPPRTWIQLASALRTTPVAAARREHTARREALRRGGLSR